MSVLKIMIYNIQPFDENCFIFLVLPFFCISHAVHDLSLAKREKYDILDLYLPIKIIDVINAMTNNLKYFIYNFPLRIK